MKAACRKLGWRPRAFSEKRLAEPDSNVRCAPAKSETFIRLTPQGEQLADRLAAQTPKQRERTMSKLIERAKRAEIEKRECDKLAVLDILRTKSDTDSDGQFILLEKICSLLDITIIEAVLLLHEINGNQIEPDDTKLYVYAFLDHGSGRVYVELWEPESATAPAAQGGAE